MPKSFSLEEVMGQAPAQGPVDPELEKQIARYEQMPSKGKPFTAAAKYLNPNIPGHPEYNDEGKSPLQVLYQEREAQRKKAPQKGFTFEEMFGTSEKKPETAPGEPDTSGFWAHLTKGGIEGALQETLPRQFFDRMSDVNEAEAEFARDGLWDKEKARREKAGESTSDMAFWKVRKINDIIASHKPQAPEQSMKSMLDAFVKAAVDDPGGVAAEILRGLGLHPELILTPEALPLKMASIASKFGKVAGTVAKTGTEAAQIAAASAGESMLEQAVASGKIDPTKTEFDALVGAAPVVGARALLPKQKVQARIAADFAVAKDAKAKGTEPSTELAKEITEQTDKGVAEGKTLQQAAEDAAKAVGVSEDAAADAAKMLEPVEQPKGVTDAERDKSAQVRDEGEAARGSEPVRGVPSVDRPELRDRQEPAATQGGPGKVAAEAKGQWIHQSATPIGEIRDQPIWFSRDNVYGGTAAYQLKTELGLVKPFLAYEKGSLNKVLDAWEKKGGDQKAIDHYRKYPAEFGVSMPEDLRATLKDLGYDSVIQRGTDVRGKPWEWAIALNPKEQIPGPKQIPPSKQPLPEGVPNRFATADEARRIYEMAGFDELVAKATADKPIAMSALRARLANRMGGQKFADGLLKEAAERGMFGETGKPTIAQPAEHQELVIPSPATGDTPAPVEAARDLASLKGEIGWAEKGGRIIREQPKTIEEMRDKDFQGEVVGGTKWVPLSDFWPGRPDKKLTQRGADAAIDKALKGEKLSPIEQRFIDYANEELKYREGEVRKSAEAREAIEREEIEERLAIQEESARYGKEVGAVDPRILAALGITAAVGGGELLYTEDPKKAVMAALAAGGVVAAGALLHRSVGSVGKLFDKIRDTRFRITDITDGYFKAIESGRLANFRFSEQVKALVKDPKQREQITHWIQGDKSIKLSPEALQVAAAIEDFFKTMGEKGQKAGILPEELLEQYVTQLWTGLNKNSGIVRNMVQALGNRNMHAPGMSPRTRFSMERQIPSYKAGMDRGMIPSTLDIAEIVRIYGDNINKAIANKNLVSALKRTKTPWGETLVIRDTPEEIAAQIRQTAAILDKQWEGGGDLAKDIRDFAIRKAPREYVTIDNPNMRGLKVHQDIAPVMKNLFDAAPNAVTNLFYAASVAAKRGIFSYSFFHVKSLADAMLGTSMRGWVHVLNGDAYRMLREGKPGDIVDLGVQNGLKVVEKPLEGDVTPFTNALKLIEEKYPVIGAPVKGIRTIGRVMDTFLWSTVHPTFKTAAFMAAFERTMKRSPDMTRAQAAKAAASFTNDIFGSLDWFRMADEVQNRIGRDLALAVTSPRGRKWMQIMMLAPDWTVATTRAMVKAIPGVSSREIAALHQGYVVRSAILYLTVANGLNYAFTGHSIFQNKDKTMVDLGDGRKMQLSKHFMEPIHWLLDPGQQALNKLGWVVKEFPEQALNKQWLSAKGAPPIVTEKKDENPLQAAARHLLQRTEHAVGGVMPITAQTIAQQGVVPALAGFFGFPIYGKTDEQYVKAAGERAEEQGKDREKAEKRAQKRRDREKRKREAEQ